MDNISFLLSIMIDIISGGQHIVKTVNLMQHNIGIMQQYGKIMPLHIIYICDIWKDRILGICR